MPAGVSWPQYLRYVVAALGSMALGSQMVHMYYDPLGDLEKYVEKVKEEHGLSVEKDKR